MDEDTGGVSLDGTPLDGRATGRRCGRCRCPCHELLGGLLQDLGIAEGDGVAERGDLPSADHAQSRPAELGVVPPPGQSPLRLRRAIEPNHDRAASHGNNPSPGLKGSVGAPTRLGHCRRGGKVHVPEEMSRRSSVSHASASTRYRKVPGALWSPWSGPVYRARQRLLVRTQGRISRQNCHITVTNRIDSVSMQFRVPPRRFPPPPPSVHSHAASDRPGPAHARPGRARATG
jgi:hypothetical protein